MFVEYLRPFFLFTTLNPDRSNILERIYIDLEVERKTHVRDLVPVVMKTFLSDSLTFRLGVIEYPCTWCLGSVLSVNVTGTNFKMEVRCYVFRRLEDFSWCHCKINITNSLMVDGGDR